MRISGVAAERQAERPKAYLPVYQILGSALPPHLKLTAIAFALHGRSDGTSIFPGVARVAKMVSKSARAVRNDLNELCERGVLVSLTPRTGQGGKPTQYRFRADALPKWGRDDAPGTGLPNVDGDAPVIVSESALSGTQLRGGLHPGSAGPEACFSRTTKELVGELERAAIKQAPSTAPTEYVHESPLHRVAWELLEQMVASAVDGELSTLLRDHEKFVEVLKARCIELGTADVTNASPEERNRACLSVAFRFRQRPEFAVAGVPCTAAKAGGKW